MSQSYYVLCSHPGELAFIDTLQDAFDLIKEQYGFEFKYANYEQGAVGLGRHVYWETGKRCIINLVDDFSVPVCYLTVEAATREEVTRIGGWLTDLLPIFSLPELQEEARNKMLDDPQALFRMALGTGEQADPVSLEILRNGLQNDNDLVRFRAAAAVSLTEWPEFLPDLESMKQQDPSPEVQEMVQLAIEACRKRLPPQ